MAHVMSASSARGHRLRSWLLAPFVLALPGCLVDKGRCGPHQESNVAGNCVCVSGFVPDDSLVCRPCGENELSIANNCACNTGFARDPVTMLCSQQTLGVGQPCTRNEDCLASAPTCHDPADQDPYCTTTGCTDDGQCPGSYACDTSATPTRCLRPPIGQFDACASQADCAGKQASYCEETTAKVCLVPNCKSDDDCFAGLECCDLTRFGIPSLCIAEGSCPVQ